MHAASSLLTSISNNTKRKPHFLMEDITSTWSYPSRDPSTKLTNGALTALNLIVQLYVLANAAGTLLTKAPGIINNLLLGTEQLLSVAALPAAFILLGTPAIAVAISLTIQRSQI